MNVCQSIHFESNGLDGINYIKNLMEKDMPLPEVILLDVYMPVLDGFGFVERFNSLKVDDALKPCIVFISASEKSKEHSKMSQQTRFICKPVDNTKLADIFLTVPHIHNLPLA